MRSFKTLFDSTLLDSMQKGVLEYTYKGISCMKCPLDMAIYTKLIWDIKPGSLIEIGTHKGGSALWFADTLSAAGLDTKVISIDYYSISDVKDPRIEFHKGDVNNLSQTLTEKKLASLPRPWLVVEDSAHTYQSCMSTLQFFNEVLRPNEVLVVEDGVLDDLGMSEQYEGGPNRAIAEFLADAKCRFEVMTSYCDLYGVNATYNPNGFLKKIS
jgi:cephalosporin hydroxylase